MSRKAKGELTPLQQRFVKEYLLDLNATAAYKRAGYRAKNDNAAASGSAMLLRNPKVSQAIAEGKGKQVAKLDLKAERILLEYVRIGFFDPRQLFDANNNLKPVKDWPDEVAACVSSVETIEEYEGTGKSRKFKGYVRKVRFWPKVEALR